MIRVRRVCLAAMMAFAAACAGKATSLYQIPSSSGPAEAPEDALQAYSRGETRFLAFSAPRGPAAPGIDPACAQRLTRSEVRITHVWSDRLTVPKSAADSLRVSAEQARMATEREYMAAFNGRMAQLTGRCGPAAA
jgi:hypothetical protein